MNPEETIQSLFSTATKMTKTVEKMDTKTLLIGAIVIGVLIVILGGMEDGILDSNTVIVAGLVAFAVHYWTKKKYQRYIHKLRLQLVKDQQTAYMDQLCQTANPKHKTLCEKYQEAKANFRTIVNTLIQQSQE